MSKEPDRCSCGGEWVNDGGHTDSDGKYWHFIICRECCRQTTGWVNDYGQRVFGHPGGLELE